MPIFDQLSREAARRGLKFLVIGAHAVMRHGYLRATEDADILVNKDERNQWEELARQLGYSVLHDGGTFLQLTPADGIGWELDLMFVSSDTFARMLHEAKAVEIEGATVSVPSLEHLLALKLHALKHGRGIRNLKDMDDVIRLALANRVDIRSESFRLLVEKHGDKETMNASSEPALNEPSVTYRAAEEPALGLEFPDWSGHRSAPSTLGVDEMLRYCEAMMPHVRSFPWWRQRRLAGRCRVEFRL